jgi:hypothetical protein
MSRERSEIWPPKILLFPWVDVRFGVSSAKGCTLARPNGSPALRDPHALFWDRVLWDFTLPKGKVAGGWIVPFE